MQSVWSVKQKKKSNNFLFKLWSKYKFFYQIHYITWYHKSTKHKVPELWQFVKLLVLLNKLVIRYSIKLRANILVCGLQTTTTVTTKITEITTLSTRIYYARMADLMRDTKHCAYIHNYLHCGNIFSDVLPTRIYITLRLLTYSLVKYVREMTGISR